MGPAGRAPPWAAPEPPGSARRSRAAGRGRLLPRLAALQHRQDQAAVLALHVQEHREGRAHAHLLGVAGVDAGDDGLGDALQRLSAEAPADEVAEALVEGRADGARGPRRRRAAAGQDEVQAHADLARPRHQTAHRERHHARGDHEDDALGQLVQAPAREDEALADVLVAVEEAVADADLAGGRDRPRLLDDGRVRAALDDEPVAADGVDLAAEARVLLVQLPVDGRVLGARRFEHARRAQAGHAAADDDDAELLAHPCVCGSSGCRRARSTGRCAR